MQKLLGIIRYACAATLVTGQGLATADPLKLRDFQWQNRLIVDCDLRAPEREPEAELSAASILLEDESNVRKLVLIRVTSEDGSIFRSGDETPRPILFDDTERTRLVTQIDCAPPGRAIALFGLDGGVKHVWRDEVPSAQEVYALIDEMPMRLQEMRRD